MTADPGPDPERVAEFRAQRFGLFVHWGLYSLAARHEWVKNREHLTDADYQPYFDHFDPDLYDPSVWAAEAAAAGMKYAVLTTKHHEGFALWDSALTDYRVTNTPHGTDLVGPFVDAFRGAGLGVGFYHSLIDWHHPDFTIDGVHPQRDLPREQLDQLNTGRELSRYADYLHGQVTELLTRYGVVDTVWFDFSYDDPAHALNGRWGGKGASAWRSAELLALVRRLQPRALVNDRLAIGGDFTTPEQYQPYGPMTVDGRPVVWEACQTINGSWGYDRDNLDAKPVDLLVRMLVDTVSKDGKPVAQRRPERPRRARPAGVEIPARHRRLDAHPLPLDPRRRGLAPSPHRPTCATPSVGTGCTCTVSPGPSAISTCPGWRARSATRKLLNDASQIRWLELGPKAAGEHTTPGGVPAGTLSLQLPVRAPDRRGPGHRTVPARRRHARGRPQPRGDRSCLRTSPPPRPYAPRSLRRVEEGIAAGPFSADWESLRSGYRVPTWYADAKFGIFIHWGPYCVPGFSSEWYPREMYRQGTAVYDHHREVHGPQETFGYKDFIPDLTGSQFDPDDWASLFRRAGAQFVVPVAEHHDGFPMYATDLTRWNAARLGPGRDVVRELSDSVRAQSMIAGASSHRAEHWWFFNGGMRFDSDVRDPEYADLYGPAQREEITPTEQYLEDWLARTVDLVEHNDPQLVWFDWWIEQDVFRPWLAKFAAWYYNRGIARNRPVAINYKFEAFDAGSAVYDVERGQNADIRPMLWQNDTSVAVHSWGWVHGQQYKDVKDILGDLLDVVSKNGALLLNVGPKPDGSFEPEERALLERIGDWFAVNVEAIYGTTPFAVSGEGPTEVSDSFLNDAERVLFGSRDIRFTARGDLVYAVPLDWPATTTVLIKTFAEGAPHSPEGIGSVELLGAADPLAWEQSTEGLLVHLPARPAAAVLPVLRITPAVRSADARKRRLRN